MLKLDPQTTALVVIDLQQGIVRLDIAPHPATQIVAHAKQMAELFRKHNAPVVLVNVVFAKDLKDLLQQPVDQPNNMPAGGYPDAFGEIVEGLAQPGDIRITKRQWGAFYGTELDLQLRRRGIKTIVLAGIATNIGVESTARQAFEHGYALLTVEDATGTFSQEMQDFAFTKIFPRISKVVKTADLAFA